MSKLGNVIYVTNTAWTLYTFRINLMLAMQCRGYEVIACAPQDKYADNFARHGIKFIDVPLSQVGKNPLRELKTVLGLWRLYRKERPVLVHHFSTKAIVWGSLAAHLAGVKSIVNTVTGISYRVSTKGLVRTLIQGIYWFSLRNPAWTIFQNPDDRRYFLENGLVSDQRSTVILGSGVDMGRYAPNAASGSADSLPERVKFLMFGRMIWAKGVREYVEAARKVKQSLPDPSAAKFVLLGGATVENPTQVDNEWLANPLTIPGHWLQEQASEGSIEWHPHDNNVLPYLHETDAVVLPSYYPEGVPRSLLEAMSSGKSIITTDMPGCRETVVDGVNGFLVKPRDVESLAAAMKRFVDHPQDLVTMGQASRARVSELFSDAIVIANTMDVYNKAGLDLS